MKEFWIVNAFASGAGQGGPAGVFIYDSYPDDSEMIRLSKSLNFSNCAFLVRKSENNYKLRWFTPVSEALLCGHATLAAGHVLFSEKLVDCTKPINFHISQGKVSIELLRDATYKLDFPAIKVTDIAFDEQWLKIVGTKPLRCTTDGICLLMEFKDFDVLQFMIVNLDRLKTLEYRALVATAKGVDGYDFASRYFAPKVGINEDPVCVSAHCRLVPYWSKISSKNKLKAFQASKRTASLDCELIAERVYITGEAVTIYKGPVDEDKLSILAKLA